MSSPPPQADPTPLSPRERVGAAVLLILAGFALVWGWKTFWFLCDDAYIAFRYVSNAQFGHGYTWNPPPFRPVEGYTSFLWVFLLDVVWRFFGVDPTVSANPLSLAFSFGSVGLVAWLGLRARWPAVIAHQRVWLVGLVLFGTLSNRTFLAWTTSGLETAMFSFLVLAWVTLGLLATPDRRAITGLAALASAIALCRPDGLLFMGATGLLWFLWLFRAGRPVRGDLLAILPFALPVAHLLWRRWVYGFWLPNTWYAKAVGGWPQAGWRYAASFALEYAWWWWAVIALGAGGSALVMLARGARPRPSAMLLMRLCVVSTVVTQFMYYTFRVGGDHFEYRVYHHLVPLLLLALPWLWAQWRLAPRLAAGLLAAQIAFGLPLPWLHWSLTHQLETRALTHRMRVPVAPHLPAAAQWYGRRFDTLQDWLIVHFVGMRHQEHKVFGLVQLKDFPTREQGLHVDPTHLPVMIRGAVGVPGWVLPNVYIIDRLGLNDAVVARNPVPPNKDRRMAHDRRPPKGYVECFKPNVTPGPRAELRFKERSSPLTAEDVVACEKRFAGVVRYLQRVADGKAPPPPPKRKPRPNTAPPGAHDTKPPPGAAGVPTAPGPVAPAAGAAAPSPVAPGTPSGG